MNVTLINQSFPYEAQQLAQCGIVVRIIFLTNLTRHYKSKTSVDWFPCSLRTITELANSPYLFMVTDLYAMNKCSKEGMKIKEKDDWTQAVINDSIVILNFP